MVTEKKVEKASQMTSGEAAAASTLVMAFVIGLLCLYLTIPDSDDSFLKLPRTLQDLQLLRGELERYKNEYTAQVVAGYCLVYIFMQTLMIPGTVFLSLLAGALFGVLKGLVLVVCTATVSFFLLFPVKTRWSFHCVFSLARQSQILPKPGGKEKGEYVELYAFSETDSNVTSYIHKCCFSHGGCAFSYIFPGNSHWTHTCCFCHSQGTKLFKLFSHIIYLTENYLCANSHTTYYYDSSGFSLLCQQAGLTLGELKSLGDLYDFSSIATLFLIGIVSVAPTLMSKSKP